LENPGENLPHLGNDFAVNDFAKFSIFGVFLLSIGKQRVPEIVSKVWKHLLKHRPARRGYE
jgi:hypothetical protein